MKKLITILSLIFILVLTGCKQDANAAKLVEYDADLYNFHFDAPDDWKIGNISNSDFGFVLYKNNQEQIFAIMYPNPYEKGFNTAEYLATSLNRNPTLTANAKIEKVDVPGAQSAHRAVFNVKNGINVSYIIKAPDSSIVRIFSIVKSSEGVTEVEKMISSIRWDK